MTLQPISIPPYRVNQGRIHWVGVRLLLLFGLYVSGLGNAVFAQTSSIVVSADPALADALPPPWTLAQLTRAADVIAEVRIATLTAPDPQYGSRSSQITVERWLKQPNELTGSDLLLAWRGDQLSDLPPSYQVGAHYIVFLNHTAMWGSDSGWNNRYRLHPTGGVADHRDPGLFQLVNGSIGDAGLSPYKGWSLSRFEKAISTVLATPTAIAPDPAPAGLASLIRYVDTVADVDIVYQDVATGFTFHTLSARQWFKRPDYIEPAGLFGTIRGRDPFDAYQLTISMAEDSDHRIIFAAGRGDHDLTAAIAVYGIHDGYVVSESFARYVPDVPRPHSYLGWSADRFYAAIRAAQRLADSPAALLPQSGQGAAPPVDWLLAGWLAFALGVVIRKRATTHPHVQT